jgi:hypothetical protein
LNSLPIDEAALAQQKTLQSSLEKYLKGEVATKVKVENFSDLK